MRSDSRRADQVDRQAELQMLRELTQRVGSNPLLAQASTGNTSIKLDGVLWIKASGRWMADARQNEILIPLDLADVHRECLQRDLDPAKRYPGASLETAMHSVADRRPRSADQQIHDSRRVRDDQRIGASRAAHPGIRADSLLNRY
jgi:rhamnose utilization protein RhaD (predicted bifunctional aldolase and dehydrogenase)